MKKRTRKLMSLVMALAIVCSMIPAAMAYTMPGALYGYTYSGQQSIGLTTTGSQTLNPQFPQYINTGLGLAELVYVSWDTTGTGVTVTEGVGGSAVVSATGGLGSYGNVTATAYYQLSNGVYQGIAQTATFNYDVSVGTTPYTGQEVINNGYNNYYPGAGYDPNYGYVPNYGYQAVMSQSTLGLTPGGTGTLSVSPYAGYITPISYTWNSSDPTVASVTNSGTYTATVTGLKAGQTTITGYIYGQSLHDGSYVTASASCVVTVGGGSYDSGHFYIAADSLQLQPNGSYNLFSAVRYAGSTLSDAQMASLTWVSSNPSVASVYGTATGASVYVYGLAAGQTTIMATLPGSNNAIYAYANITVGSNAAGEITYNLTTGQSKALSAADFSEFWSKVAGPTGSLASVTFGTPTGNVGQLKYPASANASTLSVVGTGATFYVNPTVATQRALSSVSFVPTAYGTTYYTGTLTVPFVASGTAAAYGASVTYNGTLTITVTNGNVDTINYNVGGAPMALNPADFVTVYNKAMNVTTANPTVYIRFQNVPAFGTLYYNYNNYGYNYGYGSTGTALTAANIGSMYFSSLATAGYGIDDLTYVPAASGAADTVRYTAYSTYGGTALYTGEIKFSSTAAKTHVVKFHTTPGTTVKLALEDFQALDALKGYNYIALGSPTGGKLYTDYKNGTGAAVSKNTNFTLDTKGVGSMKSINAVTVVPTTSAGVVSIPFTATAYTSTYTGAQLTGTIEVYVAKKFPDVSAANWANEFITELAAKGVVSGDDKGNFNPKADLKYGEALKMIMEACGYSKQVKTGTHWASGYLTKAYADDLVDSNTIDLNKTITRDEIAEITAKALGLKATYTADTGISNPVDNSNGYVQALYNAGILAGTFEGSKNYYYGSQPIIREQISKIICLAADYYEGKGGTVGSTITGSTVTPGTTVTGGTTITGGTTPAVGSVYVSEYTTTYHKTSTCGGVSYPTLVTVARAEASGRSACTTCFPK